MDNRRMFREISRLRTTDLLIAKMDCTRRIALFKSLKLGLLGLLGIFVGHVAKSLLAAQAMSWIDYLSVSLAMTHLSARMSVKRTRMCVCVCVCVLWRGGERGR